MSQIKLIQVLQGPYITNTYGNGIQCQGPTMNVTPFLTGNIAIKRPYEDYWMDPVYNNVDANNDDVPDNPGEILYYKPVRTGQKDSSTVSLGISATWSKPLDKDLQQQCKDAAAANIALMEQSVANKRLDFEIARLKNCGELMKAGIMFHPKSPYYKVCADVVLVNPPGVVADHTHTIEHKPLPTTLPTGDASDFKRNINRQSMKVEFEKQFGKYPWYAKAERWAKKQKFPISFLALGHLIAYLKKVWINVKIENPCFGFKLCALLQRHSNIIHDTFFYVFNKRGLSLDT